MESIYLIGFMGAGKTTVSKELGKKLAIEVYDTDEEIVRKAGKSINDIFAEQGEVNFRDMESSALESVPDENAVIATGGGIILSEKNRLTMQKRGFVVFLYAHIDEILNRLEGDTTRPLLQSGSFEAAKELYVSRLELYRETADIEIDTSGKQAPQIANEIIMRMKQ